MSCAPACFPASIAGCATIGSLCGNLAQDAASTSKKDGDDSAAFKGFAKPTLSARGAKHAASVTPFWTVFDSMLRDVYCPAKNQNGIINMGIANNSLMQDELLEYFTSNLSLDPTDLTYGTSLHGSIRLFDAVCAHFNRDAFAPVEPVKPEQILTGPGCGPLLDQLFEHLAAPGEACLAAAPYYNGFDADLMTRAQVECVPVFASSGDGTETENFVGKGALRGFEAALGKQRDIGSPVRAILVCNPHNPIGKCYDRQALIEYGKFAQSHALHLVFDEIYAMSTFPTSDNMSPQPFISALNIDWAREAGCDPRRIHILTSASKDFGLNGFRVGIFISQHNSELMAAMKVTTKLYMVSSPADALFSSLLVDQKFYPYFVRTNQARLSRAYETVKQWCTRHAIPYTPSNAGHFLLVDLGRFLPHHMGEHELIDETERETALWSQVLKERLCITPGSNYHHPQVGWFRVTFSLQDEVLAKGLQRLEKALGLRASEDWDSPTPAAGELYAIAVKSSTSEEISDAGPAQAVEQEEEVLEKAINLAQGKRGEEMKPSLPTLDRSGLISALCGPPASAEQASPPLASRVASQVMEDYDLLKQLSLDAERGRALGCMC